MAQGIYPVSHGYYINQKQYALYKLVLNEATQTYDLVEIDTYGRILYDDNGNTSTVNDTPIMECTILAVISSLGSAAYHYAYIDRSGLKLTKHQWVSMASVIEMEYHIGGIDPFAGRFQKTGVDYKLVKVEIQYRACVPNVWILGDEAEGDEYMLLAIDEYGYVKDDRGEHIVLAKYEGKPEMMDIYQSLDHSKATAYFKHGLYNWER